MTLFACLAISVDINSKGKDIPWTAYFGSHYVSTSWSQAIRDPGGPGLAGFMPPTSSRHRIRASNFDKLLNDLEHHLIRKDVVLGVGGLGSGRDQESMHIFLDFVRADGGMRWRQELAKRVERVARLPHAQEHVYWQFGNEINGSRFIKHLAEWSGIVGSNREVMSREIIPIYVEYFLAPGIEAIHSASQKIYGRSDLIHIMLGSLGNARRPHSIAWYEELLGYQIKGTYADKLAGKHVYDVVDTLSIHYLVTAPDSYWQTALNDLERRWIGKGLVQRLWSTEELGARRARSGYGASIALQITARYLSWWQRHGWTPDRGRCFFWGYDLGAVGTRAADSLSTLYDFLGPVSLRESTGQKLIKNGDLLESYLFHSASDEKRVLIAFVPGRGSPTEIQAIRVPKNGWESISTALLHVFSPNGHKILDVKTSAKGDYLELIPGMPIKLESSNAMLLLLHQSTR